MTYEKLNSYIFNYLENDKTNSAIMLTGGWGTGKSYYIEHTLKPFLTKHNKDCVVVSLYGLKELSDLNRAVYLEARFKKLNPKSEKAKTGIIVGKTIIKGVASRLSIDLSQDNSDWQELYESIDLTNKLLILEDVERTSIDIIELLGYVNNLVEQDGVKVLLVCNEGEIAKKEEVEVDDKNGTSGASKQIVLEYTDEAKAYLQYKEKTIVDTLVFVPDVNSIVTSIIDYFEDERLYAYKNDEFCSNLEQIFYWEKSVNFRTFIFATQKFLDITNCIDVSGYNNDFIEMVYYSIIAFSIRYKDNRDIKWDGNNNYSLDLGMNLSPLYKDCFDYIVYQDSTFSHFNEYYNDYLDLYNHKSIIDDFHKYYVLTEQQVVNRLLELEDKIVKNDISISIYPLLLLHLVNLEKNIEYDISNIIKHMVRNVKGQANKLGGEHAFYFATEIEDKDMLVRYHEISNKLIEASEETEGLFCDFFYQVEMVENDCKRLGSLFSFELNNKSFITRINISKLVDLIMRCSSKDILNIRTLFQSIYKHTKPEYDKTLESEGLKELQREIGASDKSNLDKIQILNIKRFENDIKSYVDYLLEE